MNCLGDVEQAAAAAAAEVRSEIAARLLSDARPPIEPAAKRGRSAMLVLAVSPVLVVSGAAG
jgi:hypothetical protein